MAGPPRKSATSVPLGLVQPDWHSQLALGHHSPAADRHRIRPVHELVHIHEPNHTPELWTRLERAMPNYQARKPWLAQHGDVVVTL
jgi:hypothetical protein